MTSVPYEVEPVAVGTRPKDPFHAFNSKELNDRAMFPSDRLRYTIECRLSIHRYTRPEADARCKEIHGTNFDGCFASGSYYTYWSKA